MKKRDIEKRIAAKEELNYAKLGLRCGLEIHQRLDTKKLFCNCSSHQKEEPNDQILRRLNPVPGELGGVDMAALYEFKRSKSFIYKTSPGECCLVELDEEPPHELNAEALNIGMQVCKLLHCKVPDEIHVMRKTVIDGSNTTGFQRTAVIGMDGWLEMPWGDVTITQVAIEEEACRIEQRSEGEIIYRLSGLGIPLLEITTGIIDEPERTLETAKRIGLLLRSCKVQRGIGSIRQDVNVSIKGGARVEIKGFQELELMPKLIKNEAKRQLDLIEIRDELTRRESHVEEEAKDVTDIFKTTKNDLLRKIILPGGRVFAIYLPEFAGLFKHECGDRTFGKEMAAYAQTYGLGGIIHTDEEIGKYQLSTEFEKIVKDFQSHSRQPSRKSHKEPQDLIAIVAGQMPNVKKAAEAILERCRHAMHGVDEETRVADGAGSKYTRPLPGVARMYPETDVPPISITPEFLASIPVPITLMEKKKGLEKELPNELQQILTSKHFPLYEKFTEEGHDPVLVATMFLNTLRDISRRGFDTETLSEEQYRTILLLIKEGRMPRDMLGDALIMLLQGKTMKDIESSFSMLGEKELCEIVKSAIRSKPDAKESVIMGMVMGKARGRASGAAVAKIVKEAMK